jgi:predicted metal-binding membrane protein
MAAVSVGAGPLELALRRDRVLVAIGIGTIAVLAWAYIVEMSRMMLPDTAMAMPMAGDGSAPQLRFLVPMWIVMMVATMIPSAAPTILLFANVVRRRRAAGVPAASAAVFTLGYLLVWALYAILAALTQWKLHQLALLSSDMTSASPWLGGGLLIVAGLYQWLPSKGACLSHCQSPLHFFSSHWREGSIGALVMGIRHGTYCVGCCWALMALLFVAGVMNLLWVAAIGIFVLAEKLVFRGRELGRAAGFLLVAWGVWVLIVGQ